MRYYFKLNLLCCAILFCFVYSCKKKDKTDTSSAAKDSFDRKAMLTNIGDNLILPAYKTYYTACTGLDSAVTDFSSNPSEVKLSNLQNIFKNTYRCWQSVSSFGFGPAEQEYLKENTNIFPTDSAKINANISSGSYDLNAIVNLDTKGLPALDYLLFGLDKDNSGILKKYTVDANATKRKKYLTDISAAVKSNMAAVINAWGNYMTTFIGATGTDVGSSLGQFINELDKDLEILKNAKIGIPLGKQSMGNQLPAKVEAFYSGNSVELALLHLKSLQTNYLGKDGSGLDDYLEKIDARYNNGTLNDAIKNQFTVAFTKLQSIPDPLSANITVNPSVVNAAYVEIQKLVVLLKTDMPTALGVLITFEDNDGD